MKTWQLALIMYGIYTSNGLTKRFSDAVAIIWLLLMLASLIIEKL